MMPKSYQCSITVKRCAVSGQASYGKHQSGESIQPEDCKVMSSLELVNMPPLLRQNHCKDGGVQFVLLHVNDVRNLQQACRCDSAHAQ